MVRMGTMTMFIKKVLPEDYKVRSCPGGTNGPIYTLPTIPMNCW